MAGVKPEIPIPEKLSRKDWGTDWVDWKLILPSGCGSSVGFDLFNMAVEKMVENLRILGINVWAKIKEETPQNRSIHVRGFDLSDKQLFTVESVFDFYGIVLEKL